MSTHKLLIAIPSLLLATAAMASGTHAGGHDDEAPGKPGVTTKVSQAAAMDMSDAMTAGEVRKVDKETRKITLKHGDIKNLDMPGMTMVFQVKDLAMLDNVKAGDRVLFRAEKSGGALVVTDLQPAK
jgi:Cu(I)/Ag(I) efflux system protein CusF